MDINFEGYASKESKEFQKHLEIVKMCIKHNVSYPKETLDFFDESGIDLTDYEQEHLLEIIKNGITVVIPYKKNNKGEIIIKVQDIPKECDEIIIWLE